MIDISIYEMEHSPFCIPVTQVLTALGVEYERIPVPNWNRELVIKATEGSYYQVPVLKHGDTVVIESSPDSQDIAQYIDQAFAGGRLFPESNAALQEILIEHIENDIEAVTFKLVDSLYIDSFEDPVAKAMTIRHKERKFGAGCVASWREHRPSLKVVADQALDRFDRILRQSPFILGDEPYYVDFSLYGVIGNYTYRAFNEIASEHDALVEWSERLAGFCFD